MSEMKDRIFTLRKTLNLTLEEFGKRIGVSITAVASYEKGKREPITPTITVICNEFHVSRKWLVDGIGEMFDGESEDYSVEKIIEIFHCSEQEAQFLQLYFAMSEADRQKIYNYLKMMKNVLESILNSVIESKK